MGIQHKNVKKPGGNLHCIMAFQKSTWQHHRKIIPTASIKRMLQGEEEDEIQTDGSITDECNYIASDSSD